MAEALLVVGVAESDEFKSLSTTASVLATLCDDLTVTTKEVASRDALSSFVGSINEEFKADTDAVAVFNGTTVLSPADALSHLKRTYVGRGATKVARGAHAEKEEEEEEDGKEYDYDLTVIGGGSAGLAAAKRAAETYKKKVLLLDFVKPSPAGTKWGLGGTCVNVGCIPKKLFHTAALYGETRHASGEYGWEEAGKTFKWATLMQNVNDYIRSLNFSYRGEMVESGVKYKNALGSFVDPHTIKMVNRRKRESTATTRRVLIAVGGRPRPLACPGGELAISSDDIFTLDEDPGKTLVIGASYVALECAGFLHGTGHDTTVMVRSIFLRGFDQDMANKIGEHMDLQGVKFLKPATPSKIERQEDGKLKVTWTSNGEESSDVFDTVLSAIGRTADTAGLNLEAAGVKVEDNGKLRCVHEQTNVSNIYACGDVLHGQLELTPVAIQAAKMLVDRLYGGSTKAMDYSLVPTTVFTPLEYGACGLSEEDAIALHGADNVEVFHNKFTPLEWAIAPRSGTKGYIKLVCNMRDSLRVIGLHYLGPNAGEVTQGFATALRLGATYDDVFSTVGIHPTTAEKFTTLTATKRNGESIDVESC